MRGGGPSAVKKELASKAKLAPANAAVNSSTIIANAEPLASPMGTMVPASAAPRIPGGVALGVQRPALGDRIAAFLRQHHFAAGHRAERQIHHQGRMPARGQAKPMGLVPKLPRVPPQGAIPAGVLLNPSAISPCSATLSTWYPKAPQ